MSDIEPEEPHEAGVPEKVADSSREEGARTLGDQARERLTDKGFTDKQIREWAETYIADQGSGNVDSFIAWIAEQERSGS
jgi:hypothetical protein